MVAAYCVADIESSNMVAWPPVGTNTAAATTRAAGSSEADSPFDTVASIKTQSAQMPASGLYPGELLHGGMKPKYVATTNAWLTVSNRTDALIERRTAFGVGYGLEMTTNSWVRVDCERCGIASRVGMDYVWYDRTSPLAEENGKTIYTLCSQPSAEAGTQFRVHTGASGYYSLYDGITFIVGFNTLSDSRESSTPVLHASTSLTNEVAAKMEAFDVGFGLRVTTNLQYATSQTWYRWNLSGATAPFGNGVYTTVGVTANRSGYIYDLYSAADLSTKVEGYQLNWSPRTGSDNVLYISVVSSEGRLMEDTLLKDASQLYDVLDVPVQHDGPPTGPRITISVNTDEDIAAMRDLQHLTPLDVHFNDIRSLAVELGHVDDKVTTNSADMAALRDEYTVFTNLTTAAFNSATNIITHEMEGHVDHKVSTARANMQADIDSRELVIGLSTSSGLVRPYGKSAALLDDVGKRHIYELSGRGITIYTTSNPNTNGGSILGWEDVGSDHFGDISYARYSVRESPDTDGTYRITDYYYGMDGIRLFDGEYIPMVATRVDNGLYLSTEVKNILAVSASTNALASAVANIDFVAGDGIVDTPYTPAQTTTMYAWYLDTGGVLPVPFYTTDTYYGVDSDEPVSTYYYGDVYDASGNLLGYHIDFTAYSTWNLYVYNSSTYDLAWSGFDDWNLRPRQDVVVTETSPAVPRQISIDTAFMASVVTEAMAASASANPAIEELPSGASLADVVGKVNEIVRALNAR